MAGKSPEKAEVDITPSFLQGVFTLGNEEKVLVWGLIEKITSITWDQIYTDKGLRWEKISSIKPLPGMGTDTLYSVRISRARRAVAYRRGNLMVLLYIPPNHDATYKTK